MDDRGSILVMLLFLGAWNVMAYLMAVHGANPFPSAWDTPRGVRNLGRIFLAVGVMFLGFTVYQLSTGTFRWRGQERTYSFSDLVCWEPLHDAQSN